MINLITGKTGNGKSLYAITEVEKRRLAENRPVFYHGIPDVKLDWTYFDDPKQWHTLPQGAIIVIDEAGEFFPPRSNTSAVPETVHAFSIHRKQSHDVYVLTQHPTYIDSYIRKIVDIHFHIVRVFGKETAKVHKFTSVKDNCDKDRSGSIEVKDFDYPKENYDKYRSIDGDTHTIKPHVPFKYYLRYIIPAVIIGLCVVAYVAFNKASHSGEDVANKNKELLTNSDPSFFPTANAANGQIHNPNYYFDQAIPRITNLPHTAAKYDEITKPTVAPLPAACVSMGNRCDCYSQQGTKLFVEKHFCLQVVNNGFFVDFDNGAQVNNNPRAGDTTDKAATENTTVAAN